MESNFTNQNFEEFLQKNADELRMRPTANVWKEISKHLSRRKRRIGFILGTSLLTAAALGYYLIDTSASKITASNNIIQQESSKSIATLHPHQINNLSVKTRNDNPDKSSAKPANSFGTTGQVNYRKNIETTTTDKYSETSLAVPQNNFRNIITNSFFENKNKSINLISPDLVSSDKKDRSIAISNQDIHTYKAKTKKSKLGWQLFFTPTISYRKLSENNSYLRSVSPTNIPYSYQNLYGINNVVTHKPDFGFEFGVSAKYPVNKNLRIRGGIQFNVSRYDIKVFNSGPQLATIRLNSNPDSLNTFSSYNNFSGYRTDWLHNFYFEVSAPVGVEFKVTGDEKMQFGIAATIQPTYLLSNRSYVISADYKNYSEVPWLSRKWNVNTSFETFVSYSTGHLKWQVGPQVRYQLMSSFIKKYPVKENLFDFGLKVGISLNHQ